MYDLKENAKMVFVSSLSATFADINFKDIQSSHCKNKMKIYARSKRMMIANTIHLKEQVKDYSIDINIVHPGVCATELFTKSHSKFFVKIMYPLMKLIFPTPKKVALNIIKGLFVETKTEEWIVPSGLFGVWGYPKISKMKKCIYDKDDIIRIVDITEEMINQHSRKK